MALRAKRGEVTKMIVKEHFQDTSMLVEDTTPAAATTTTTTTTTKKTEFTCIYLFVQSLDSINTTQIRRT